MLFIKRLVKVVVSAVNSVRHLFKNAKPTTVKAKFDVLLPLSSHATINKRYFNSLEKRKHSSLTEQQVSNHLNAIVKHRMTKQIARGEMLNVASCKMFAMKPLNRAKPVASSRVCLQGPYRAVKR